MQKNRKRNNTKRKHAEDPKDTPESNKKGMHKQDTAKLLPN